uniref:Putative secreted protein n=1 Tax=Anopheles darlingi TaxID=43151 RepID=A0A2M4DM70_ANODA
MRITTIKKHYLNMCLLCGLVCAGQSKDFTKKQYAREQNQFVLNIYKEGRGMFESKINYNAKNIAIMCVQ